jgi:uncharacterized Zn finger protein (UPF0148 family)
MTLAELSDRMSAAEFEIWMADSRLSSNECPSCGLEPRDMKDGIMLTKVHCPFCKTDYNKVVTPNKGVVHDMEERRLVEE